jgi:hypothetical protein
MVKKGLRSRPWTTSASTHRSRSCGGWAIILGALQLYAAIRLRKIVDNEWWPILSGLLSIAFGAVLIAWPGGAPALIWTALGTRCFWLHADRSVVRAEEVEPDLTTAFARAL